jgi:ATP-dependent helicase HrpA
VRKEISRGAIEIERTGLRTWDFAALPASHEEFRDGRLVRGFPALVDEGATVGLRVLETAASARHSTQVAVRRLLLLNVNSPAALLQRQLSNEAKLALSRNAPGGVTALLDDCLTAALDEFIASSGGLPADEQAFAHLLAAVRRGLGATLARIVNQVGQVLSLAHQVEKRLSGPAAPMLLPALVDMRAQLTGLVHPGFVAETGSARLADLPRYLRAIERRLDKVADDVNRDGARRWEVEQATRAYAQLLDSLPPGRESDADVRAIRWILEELRVSLFAQTLGTPAPVSLQRILRAIAALS